MLKATTLTLFFWNYSFYMYLNFGWKVSFFGDFIKKKFSNFVFLYFYPLSIYNPLQMFKTTTLTIVLWKYSFCMYLNFGWKASFLVIFFQKMILQRFLIFLYTFYQLFFLNVRGNHAYSCLMEFFYLHVCKFGVKSVIFGDLEKWIFKNCFVISLPTFYLLFF